MYWVNNRIFRITKVRLFELNFFNEEVSISHFWEEWWTIYLVTTQINITINCKFFIQIFSRNHLMFGLQHFVFVKLIWIGKHPIIELILPILKPLLLHQVFIFKVICIQKEIIVIFGFSFSIIGWILVK